MSFFVLFFFFNDTATTEIYTLSLHDALPIWPEPAGPMCVIRLPSDSRMGRARLTAAAVPDRKSTRLNSSHRCISYAVFCLKKKRTREHRRRGGDKPQPRLRVLLVVFACCSHHQFGFPSLLLFFFNDTATTEIYTLSLHDALPILPLSATMISPRTPERSRPSRACRMQLAGATG